MRQGLIAAALFGVLSTEPAWADFSKSQELTLLAVHSAILASQSCPYALDDRQVQATLSRKGLTRADLTSTRISALLQDDLAADTQRYQADTAAACDQAWASFGPGAPMKRLLRAK